jgi:hypothetical protein
MNTLAAIVAGFVLLIAVALYIKERIEVSDVDVESWLGDNKYRIAGVLFIVLVLIALFL